MANIPTSELQLNQGDVHLLQDHRIPALTGNAGKRLAVNSSANGFELVDKEVVYCYYTETDSTNHTGTVSMTIEQISAAVSARRAVVLKQGDQIYYLDIKGNSPAFCCLQGLNVYQISYYTSDSKWHKTTITASTAQILVCFLTYSNNEYTCNRTIQEILSAYQTGKVVICIYDTYEYYCQSCDSYNAVFVRASSVSANQSNVSGIGFSAIVYSSSAWHYYGNMNVQPILIGSGTGQNIKTINNYNILGSGNISLATSETILCTGELRSDGSTISGSLTQKGNYRIWFNLQNGLTTYNIRVYFSYSGSKWTILLDNSNNSSDFVLPSDVIKYLSVNNTPVEVTRIISTSLQTTEGRTIKAGKRMELEVEYQYYNSTHYLFIKCNYGNIPDTLDNVYM